MIASLQIESSSAGGEGGPAIVKFLLTQLSNR